MTGPVGPGPSVALVESLDRDGSVRQSWRVDRWPLAIGRALDNDVVLADPHVAAHHLVLRPPDEGGVGSRADADARGLAPAAGLDLAVGDTRNGVLLGHGRQARRLAGGERLHVEVAGDLDLHLGRTWLRVRLAGAPLAPERLLEPATGADIRWPTTVLLLAAVLAGIGLQTWLSNDPDVLVRTLAATLIAALGVQFLWAGAWALLSRLFAGQSRFGWHLRVATGAALLLLAGHALASLLAFVFDWAWASDYVYVYTYAVIACAVYGHLIAVEPQRRRLMRGVAIAGFAAAVGLAVWFNLQRTGRAGEELYMSHLFPPALRLAKPQPVDRFVQGLAPLQAELDRDARRKPDGDDDDLGDIVGQ